jgi:glycosyltransferase involved in cell wall biosynthesis
MKILIVHKYHYFRGGAFKNADTLAKLLISKGHDIMHFSMHHPKNLKYKYEKYFVPHIDFLEELNKKNFKSKIKVLKNMFYSKISRDKFKEALNFFKPDVIHLHNIHKHLTISILYEAKKRNIPIIWTLHDCSLICPNYVFLSHDKICEKCKNNKFSPLFEKCVKDSFQASLISTFERLFNDFLKIDNKIDAYISPSKFIINKYEEFGYDKKKFNYLPNFYPISNKNIKKQFKEKYFIYLGRISQEKGINTLCKAAKMTKINLKIIGDGPLLKNLKEKYESKNIKFLGYKTGNELKILRQNAWFTILPSECFENNPYAIIESFSDGVPVIGSKIGGIPELIKDEKNGYLFESKSVKVLCKKLIKAMNLNITQRTEFSRYAKKLIQKEYNKEKYYKQLIKIYKNHIKTEK